MTWGFQKCIVCYTSDLKWGRYGQKRWKVNTLLTGGQIHQHSEPYEIAYQITRLVISIPKMYRLLYLRGRYSKKRSMHFRNSPTQLTSSDSNDFSV